MKTTSERTSIPVGNQKMGAYVARPEGAGAYPGVLLSMEIFGINFHIRSVADRVAAEGYVVLVPDLFHRDAPGFELGYDSASLTKGIEIMVKTQPAGILTDVTAAHAALTKRPDVKGRGVGAIGFYFRVKRAIRLAKQARRRCDRVYNLGAIIHNPEVVAELRREGMREVARVDGRASEEAPKAARPPHATKAATWIPLIHRAKSRKWTSWCIGNFQLCGR